MTIDRCRVCGHLLKPEPLLVYDNMPSAAQHLPKARDLNDEHGSRLELCQCSGCGLLQLPNEPVPYYKEVIRASAFSAEMREFRVKQFADFVRKFRLKGKKVLELGCGRGEYLSLMLSAGADTYGLEWAEDSVEHCAKTGLKVSKGFIDKADETLENAPFDAFFIMNFLEHLPNPNAMLSGVCANLSGDGVGLVEVPNFDMILSRNLFSEFISDHLLYFTKRTLSLALELNGFEVLSCDEIWHDYILSAKVIKREKANLASFQQAQLSLKTELEGFISRFEPGKVAIWGAGHQALAVMALSELGDKIKYVVDSAPFKQGLFTPATHLPIVQPDTINSAPVDAIIVMAAAYSDEVAAILRRDFNKILKVAILRESGLELVE